LCSSPSVSHEVLMLPLLRICPPTCHRSLFRLFIFKVIIFAFSPLLILPLYLLFLVTRYLITSFLLPHAKHCFPMVFFFGLLSFLLGFPRYVIVPSLVQFLYFTLVFFLCVSLFTLRSISSTFSVSLVIVVCSMWRNFCFSSTGSSS